MNEDLEGLDKARVKNREIAYSFGEVGSVGINRYGGTIREEFLPQLVDMQSRLKVYKEMSSNDPTIGGILFMLEELARHADHRIESGGNNAVDKKIHKFIKEVFDDMETSWSELLTEILSCFTYGWSWHELVYKIRRGDNRNPKYNSKYNDGLIGWRKIPVRSQDSWNDWKYDENDELIGMEQMVSHTGAINLIPYDKSLLFRTKVIRDNPEGRSLLRNAYRPWFFKKYIEEIEAIGIERELAGLPMLTTPEGLDIWNVNDERAVALKATAEQLVSNVRRDKNQGIVKPFGWDFELVSTGGRRQIDTNQVINRYDQRIAITMLSDLIMLGTERVGSFAMAEVKKSLLGTALESQLNSIADIFNNYAIPKLIKLNNFTGYTDYPKLKFGEIETPDINNLTDFLLKLRKLGINLFPDEKLEHFLSSAAGLPEGSFDSKKKGFKEPEENENGNGKSNYNPLDYKTDVDEKSPHNKPHSTDDKEKFNALYEEGGRK